MKSGLKWGILSLKKPHKENQPSLSTDILYTCRGEAATKVKRKKVKRKTSEIRQAGKLAVLETGIQHDYKKNIDFFMPDNPALLGQVSLR